MPQQFTDTEAAFLDAVRSVDGIECAGDADGTRLLAWLEPVESLNEKTAVIQRCKRVAADHGYAPGKTVHASGAYGVFFEPTDD